MRVFLVGADDLLRGRGWAVAPERHGRALGLLLAFILLFGVSYGGVMGTFGGGRWLQMTYSATKVPLLLLVTFVIALPSFFVLNTLLGVRGDFGRVLRALVATQAGLTIILASLAPFTLVWYGSSNDYEKAVLFNAFMFAVASVTAQGLLRRFYRELIASNPVHRLLMRVWLGIYAFVGIQMGWTLRPFIGNPSQPTEFFRHGAWGNAYVEVAQMVVKVMSGR